MSKQIETGEFVTNGEVSGIAIRLGDRVAILPETSLVHVKDEESLSRVSDIVSPTPDMTSTVINPAIKPACVHQYVEGSTVCTICGT